MPHAPHLLARLLGLLAALALASPFGGSSRASAQPLGDVVVVPISTDDSDKALAAASMLEAKLLDARASLVSLHDARDRFTARSRPPQLASDSDVDVLAREAREAIEHVAFGRTAAAQKSVREVIARAERTLESLNRETTIARQILDTCLSLVRSTLQYGKRELAVEQAMRCRRLVPDLAPSEVAHPANVVGVLAEADNLLRRMRTGRLQVKSAPASQCSVYLNGRHLGTTPFQLDRAAVGEYRVQVECGRTAGRVHVVQLGDQPVRLLVDTDLDRAIASEPRLLLRYERLQHARERAVSHATQLGREIGADDVLLLSLDGEKVELLRVRVEQGRMVGRAVVGFHERRGFAEPALERALTSISEARMDGETSFHAEPEVPSAPVAAPAPPADAPAQPAAPAAQVAQVPSANAKPTGDANAPRHATELEAAPSSDAGEQQPRSELMRSRAGYALLGVAAAVIGVGVYFEVKAQAEYNRLAEIARDPNELLADPELLRQYSRVQSRWQKLARPRWSGVAGAGIATLASALLVRPRAEMPWWSYGLGAIGVGIAAGGVHQIAVTEECRLSSTNDDGAVDCRRDNDSAARGVMLAVAATSLLAVPVTHLIRRREVAVAAEANATSLRIRLSSQF